MNLVKKIKSETTAIVIAMVFVFILSLIFIEQNRGIKLYPDELGYWRNAALLTGGDWSGEAAQSSYYSYGYGFLLAPIMYFWGSKPWMMMQAATVLNAFMLASCVLAAWLTLKKLDIELDWKQRVFCAIVPSLYSSYLFYVNLSLVEIIMATCFWWLSYLLMCYLERPHVGKLVGIVVLIVFTVSLHQRTIIVLASSILFVPACIVLKNKGNYKNTIKNFIIMIVAFAALYFLYKLYDSYYTGAIYSMATDGGSGNNRVGTTAQNAVNELLSWTGVKVLLISFFGKLFSSVTGTFGVVILGLFVVIEKVEDCWKERNISNTALWSVFIAINYVLAIAATAVTARNNYESRHDVLIYGRYQEFVYGPLLLLGVIYLFVVKKNDVKKMIIALGVLALSAAICLCNVYDSAHNLNFWCHCVALSDLVLDVSGGEITNRQLIFLAGARCIAVLYAVLIVINLKNEKIRKYCNYILLTIVCLLWFRVSWVNWNEGVLEWFLPGQIAMEDVAEDVKEESMIAIFDAKMGSCFQFQLPDVYVVNYTEVEDLEHYEGTYLFTNKKTKYELILSQYFEIDKQNKRYTRWKRIE